MEQNYKLSLNVNNLNNEAIENLSSLILDSENFYTNQIAEIAKFITRKESNIKIILLAGPSAAGKTTTSSLLRLHLGMLGKRVVVISLDDFFLSRKLTPRLPDGSYDFENINSINLPKLNKFLDEIIETGKSHAPKYNFITGEPDPVEEEILIDSNTILIFEGLHALNPKLIKHNQDKACRIYIALSSNYVNEDETILSAKDVRLIRRITRDYYTRGFSPLETIELWDNVLAGEEVNIKPFKKYADFIINSTHNYEPLLYANYTKKLLEEDIKNPSSKLDKQKFENVIKKANKLIHALKAFEPIDKSLMPSTSLLWEFINAAD